MPKVYRPLLALSAAQVAHFWSRVNKNGPVPAHRPDLGPCWVWTKAMQKSGYGRFKVYGKDWYAHRVAYSLTIGTPPADVLVCHACDNRMCCRPDHLWEGTHGDNMADCAAKGRTARGAQHGARLHPECVARGDRSWQRLHPERYPRGEQHGAAKLTAVQVAEIRERAARGEQQHCLARAFGVSDSVISNIVRKKTWRYEVDA